MDPKRVRGWRCIFLRVIFWHEVEILELGVVFQVINCVLVLGISRLSSKLFSNEYFFIFGCFLLFFFKLNFSYFRDNILLLHRCCFNKVRRSFNVIASSSILWMISDKIEKFFKSFYSRILMRRINFEECDHLIRLRCVIIKAIGQGMVDMYKSKFPVKIEEIENSNLRKEPPYLNIWIYDMHNRIFILVSNYDENNNWI